MNPLRITALLAVLLVPGCALDVASSAKQHAGTRQTQTANNLNSLARCRVGSLKPDQCDDLKNDLESQGASADGLAK